MRAPLLSLGGTPRANYGQDLHGTKVTLPMGSTDGSDLGVPEGVRATETIAEHNELKIGSRVR